MSSVQGTLKLLRDYGAPESAVSDFTALAEAANKKKATQDVKDQINSTEKDNKITGSKLRETKKDMRAQKKELHNYKNRMFVGSKSDRKKLKDKLKELKEQKKSYKNRIKRNKRAISGYKTKLTKIKEKIPKAKQELQAAMESVQKQVRTLQILKQIRYFMKNIPANKQSSPEYIKLATFFNANKDKKISIKRPTLDEVPPEIQAITTKEVSEIKKEKAVRVISGVNKTLKTIYRGPAHVLMAFVRNIPKLPERSGDGGREH